MFDSLRMAVSESPLRVSSSIAKVPATAGGTTLRIAVIASMILVASTALAFQRSDIVSRTELPLAIGVFLGATTSAFAGFAFSAVAGALVLHVRTPIEAVPLMMACSTLVQSATLVSLFHSINWRGSIVLILGGALGVPLALFLLVHIDTTTFRVGFGAFLAIYSTYLFLRSARRTVLEVRGKIQGVAVGFAGGVVGGLTAMPGALPTIWCDLRGLPKDRQRSLVQPFITIMQILALAILLYEHELSADILKDLLVSLPSLAAGTALGLVLFRVANEAIFRRVVLIALLVSGLALIA